MRRAILALSATLAIACAPVLAQQHAGSTQAGDIRIEQTWARASIGQARNSAAYMTLVNLGRERDRLIGVASPAAAKAELHTHVMEGNVARMRHLRAMDVNPGEPTVLQPGGLHIMLIDLKQPLKAGETMSLTLKFEKAGEVKVEVPVRDRPGAGH